MTQVTDTSVDPDGVTPPDDTISDTPFEPEDSDTNAVDTLEEVGPDADPDSDDGAAVEADVAPDSAFAAAPPRRNDAVFMTTPNIHGFSLAAGGPSARPEPCALLSRDLAARPDLRHRLAVPEDEPQRRTVLGS